MNFHCYAWGCRAAVGEAEVFCDAHARRLPPELQARIAKAIAAHPLEVRITHRDFRLPVQEAVQLLMDQDAKELADRAGQPEPAVAPRPQTDGR